MDSEDIEFIILSILSVVIGALSAVTLDYLYFGYFKAINIIVSLLFYFIFYVGFSFIRLWIKYR